MRLSGCESDQADPARSAARPRAGGRTRTRHDRRETGGCGWIPRHHCLVSLTNAIERPRVVNEKTGDGEFFRSGVRTGRGRGDRRRLRRSGRPEGRRGPGGETDPGSHDDILMVGPGHRPPALRAVAPRRVPSKVAYSGDGIQVSTVDACGRVRGTPRRRAGRGERADRRGALYQALYQGDQVAGQGVSKREHRRGPGLARGPRVIRRTPCRSPRRPGRPGRN
jgi:hypothetical protein